MKRFEGQLCSKYLVERKPKGLNRIDNNRCTQLVHFTNRGGGG